MISNQNMGRIPDKVLVNRPRLDIPRTPLENTLTVLSVLGLLFGFYLLLRFLPMLPDRIPIHYNFTGQIDGWGSKNSLIILPGIAFVIFVVFTILERFPQIYNFPFPITERNVRTQYVLSRGLIGWLKFEIVLFFIYIEWKTIQAALGIIKGLGPEFVIIFIGTIMATITIYFIKMYKAR